jgi:regulator of protease activity HflC (stomatin/prohibitin superfamily)
MLDPRKNPSPVPATGGVAEAMTRVLTAEREAQEAVAAARIEAERILEQARREAHELLERAERTARLVHGRTEKVSAFREAQLVAAAEAQPACPDPGSVLDEAVARLAARLTGSGDA